MATRTAHEQDVRSYLGFAAVVVLVVLLAALVLFQTKPATAMAPAPEAANVSSPVEIAAPVVELAQQRVEVETVAAPEPEAAVTEPVAVADPVVAVPAAPVAVAEIVTPEPETCMEDEPCWNCETMGNKICGTPASLPVCMEDEPCWDCETMGNKICGPASGSAAATLPDCHNLRLGEAWAGAAVTCTLDGVELSFK
jgi:hypothetical protein